MNATRREFLSDAALAALTAMFAGHLAPLTAAQAGVSTWASRIGLELYTVRDLMAADYVGVLEKVAGIGYKEIEPAGGYGNLSPKEYRALLDRLGLSMPSTHSGASGAGLELEKQLEGFQTMGIKYTTISGGGRGAGGGTTAAGRPPLAPGAYYNSGTGITHNSFTEAEAFGPYRPPVTLESVKQSSGTSKMCSVSRKSIRHWVPMRASAA